MFHESGTYQCTFTDILYYAALIKFFICDAFIFIYLRVCLISYFILSGLMYSGSLANTFV